MWGEKSSHTFLQSARQLYEGRGLRAFSRGAAPTVARDVVFGVAYEVGRQNLRAAFDDVFYSSNSLVSSTSPSASPISNSPTTPSHHYFVADVIAAGCATVASSPLNFVRNIQYSAPADVKPMSAVAALRLLWRDASAKGWGAPVFLQRRLLIGWGTMRVAVALGVGQTTYEWLQRHL